MSTAHLVKSVSLDKIDPNPYRNFDLSPLDVSRVDRLVESYKTNGDFGVLSVRCHPKKTGCYQLAGGGHHRLAAMKKGGRKTADAKIVKYNNEQMLEACLCG